MNPERGKELDALFSAPDKNQHESPDLLKQDYCGNEEACREIEAPLPACEKPGTFIETPISEAQTLAHDQLNPERHSIAGRTLGHYRTIERIALGGMGEVYSAHDLKLGRKVALKLLQARFTADTERLRRFEQEARTASLLNHPNIVTIYEIDETDSGYFIATEFIEGETLRERMRRAPLKLGEVLDVATQISSALSAAHAAGVVHRDIKPENVMLRRDGIVKLLDFGLAKLTAPVLFDSVDSEMTTRPAFHTAAGVILGTAGYVSPEQASRGPVDKRTDIFSLGVLIYEMVAGRRPFEGSNTYEVLASILNDKEAPPLASIAIGVPKELHHAVTKALMKDPEARYQTADDLLNDLRNLKHHLEFEQEFARSIESSHADKLVATAAPTRRAYLRGALRSYGRRFIITGLIIAVASLTLIIATVAYRSYTTTRHQAIDSIAVLPFVNVGGDPDTEYVSDGITESLINSLSEIQQLRVVARATAFRYKNKEIDLQQVGRDLRVGAVLTGRLVQRGDTLGIQVDLVETNQGSQIWGTQYDRRVSDLLRVKQELASDIAKRLRLRLGVEDEKRLTRGDTDNKEAYLFYMRGRQFRNKASAEGKTKAIEQFRQAIDNDPNYALAYVGLADSYGGLELYTGTPSSKTLPQARAAVDRALELDNSLAEAHASLGRIEMYSWNFDKADSEFRRAIELKPNYAMAHYHYGYYLRLVMGRCDEAMAQFRWAQQLDPLTSLIGQQIAAVHVCKGELSAAIEEANKVIELDPEFAVAYFPLGHAYRRQGRYDEAIAALERGVQLHKRSPISLSYLGVTYAVAGKSDKAWAIVNELTEKYSRREAHGQYIAGVYAALGEKEQAFAWLEKDFQARNGPLPFAAHDVASDVLRDALSSDPRWKDLLHRIGVPVQN